MKVILNSEEVEIFLGATVKDAIRKFSGDLAKKLDNGKIKIIDPFGNITEPDGELTEGQSLILIEIKENEKD